MDCEGTSCLVWGADRVRSKCEAQMLVIVTAKSILWSHSSLPKILMCIVRIPAQALAINVDFSHFLTIPWLFFLLYHRCFKQTEVAHSFVFCSVPELFAWHMCLVFLAVVYKPFEQIARHLKPFTLNTTSSAGEVSLHLNEVCVV